MKKQYALIILLAIIKFVLPFLLQNSSFELHRDEYLYLQQGYHLDWGFLENPTGIAILSKISILLGSSFYTIKFWPAFFGSLTLIVACLTVIELKGKEFAILLTGIGVICGAFMRIHFLFQPNILDIFFWTCCLYFFVKFNNTNRFKYLVFVVVFAAFSWWSKYTIAYLGIGVIIGLILSKHRRLFSHKKFYVLALLLIILILENIIWQYFHNWPLIQHMIELKETQLNFISPTDFLKDQILMLFPILFVWVYGLIFCFRNSNWRIIGWVYTFTFLALITLGGKNYYLIGIYPVIIAIGAVAWEKYSENKKWLRYTLLIVSIGLTYLMTPMLIATKEPTSLATFYDKDFIKKIGLLKWEDQQNHPLPQDFADMLGWKEMGEKTSKYFNKLTDSAKKNTFIYCRNYGQAGAINYYGKNIPEVYSDNGSFLLWMPEKYPYKNLLFIGKRMPRKDDIVFQMFEKVTILDSITNPYAVEKGSKIILFENGNSKLDSTVSAGIKQLKSRFRK